ncbi:MAG TPA: type II toxin-antitoxin system HicA family toxin [Bdellovibrionota bacterium]|nr:type II toxin-antitoxin system HicA family toxin [Bdellovibrionota bacterium]
MKIRDLVAELNGGGWELDRIRGSHHVFVHPRAVRAITVPVHGNEIPDFYAKSILKQAKRALRKEG